MAGGFNSSGFGGIPSGDRASRGTGRATTAELTKSRPKPKLKKVLPEIWKLVKPRRMLLAGSFCLMLVNRLGSFALPVSSKYLVNDVLIAHHMDKLLLIIITVATATILQGLASYALTQLLSKEGQRLISDLRMQVQSHIGRLRSTTRTGPEHWSRGS